MFNEFITWIMSIFHKAPHMEIIWSVRVDAVSYSTMAAVVLKVYFDSLKKLDKFMLLCTNLSYDLPVMLIIFGNQKHEDGKRKTFDCVFKQHFLLSLSFIISPIGSHGLFSTPFQLQI